MVVARVWRLDAGGRYAHAREAKLDPKRTGDGVTVLGADDVDQGIRRAGGLSQCNGEAADHQDDEELDPAANRASPRPSLPAARPALCIILNSGFCKRCDSELHRTRRPGHGVLCVAEPLERFAGAGSRAQRGR